jgi:hypothetical protein
MKASYFYQKLHDFLIDSHPDLVVGMGDDIEEYIIQRSKAADDILEESLKNGIHMDVAQEAAFNELFNGLKFSKYDYILNVFEENYPEKYQTLIDTGQLKMQIIHYIELCYEIFNKYNINDNFPGDNNLDYEILGTIAIELEKNAVQ